LGTDLINQVILNQYRVDAFIASGGMGAVYRVWDIKRNVPLAMKVLHSDLADDPSILKRFKREANALKKLAHPNIVPFYGLYQTSDFAFLLERYVDGPSLKDILRKQQGKPLPIEEVLTYLKALSAALGYAHANGVVHCDVKPGNIMTDQGGNIYLTDFGIARHSDSTTTTMLNVGTAAYMAPEQILGEPVSPSTDIYALGVILYEMLTGQRLFRGDEKSTNHVRGTYEERVRYAHQVLPPPNPSAVNPRLNESLAKVILKALQKEASQRFQNTNELFNAVCNAINIHPELLPDRITSLSIQYFKPIEDEVDKNGSHYKRKAIVPISLAIIGVLAVAMLYMISSGSLSHLLSELSILKKQTDNPTQISSSLLNSATIELPQYTNTFIQVTDTPKSSIPTQTRRYSTPIILTSTPRYANYIFTAAENIMCRRGPNANFEHAYDVLQGESYVVIARWNNDWLLLRIDNPRVTTHTKCCWVGGEGKLNVDRGNIKQIDDWVEDMRITCDIH
jgi:eukaryotic-like serine/threonine-protein kinase